MHLVQRGGFAGAALPVEHDDVIAVLAGECLPHESKHVLTPEEHLFARHRIPGDVGINRIAHTSTELARQHAAQQGGRGEQVLGIAHPADDQIAILAADLGQDLAHFMLGGR